jgi:hypothetical protein
MDDIKYLDIGDEAFEILHETLPEKEGQSSQYIIQVEDGVLGMAFPVTYSDGYSSFQVIATDVDSVGKIFETFMTAHNILRPPH